MKSIREECQILFDNIFNFIKDVSIELAWDKMNYDKRWINIFAILYKVYD